MSVELTRYRIELEIDVATGHEDDSGTRNGPEKWRGWNRYLHLDTHLGEKVRKLSITRLEPRTVMVETTPSHAVFPE